MPLRGGASGDCSLEAAVGADSVQHDASGSFAAFAVDRFGQLQTRVALTRKPAVVRPPDRASFSLFVSIVSASDARAVIQ